jgi:hypothetical protein
MYNGDIRVREDRAVRAEEERDIYRESFNMATEDFARYGALQERYSKLHDQYVIMKDKLNRIEMNNLLNSASSMSTNFAVDLKDPIFDTIT